MKKLNRILNIIIGTFVGVLIGHGIYVVWNYITYTEIYAMQSAPWYTSILVYGIFTCVVVAVCSLIKIAIKFRIKNSK